MNTIYVTYAGSNTRKLSYVSVEQDPIVTVSGDRNATQIVFTIPETHANYAVYIQWELTSLKRCKDSTETHEYLIVPDADGNYVFTLPMELTSWASGKLCAFNLKFVDADNTFTELSLPLPIIFNRTASSGYSPEYDLINAMIAKSNVMDEQLNQKIEDETSARISADTQERTERIAEDTSLNQKIDSEISARTEGYSELNAKIESEIQDRETAIENESIARVAQDILLDDKITEETSARISADNDLLEKIDDIDSKFDNVVTFSPQSPTGYQKLNIEITSTTPSIPTIEYATTSSLNQVSDNLDSERKERREQYNALSQNVAQQTLLRDRQYIEVLNKIISEANARQDGDSNLNGRLVSHVTDMQNPHNVRYDQIGLTPTQMGAINSGIDNNKVNLLGTFDARINQIAQDAEKNRIQYITSNRVELTPDSTRTISLNTLVAYGAYPNETSLIWIQF